MADNRPSGEQVWSHALPGRGLPTRLGATMTMRRVQRVAEGDVEGPPGFVPPPGSVLRATRWRAPAGRYSVYTTDGLGFDAAAFAAAYPGAEPVAVGAHDGRRFASSAFKWAVVFGPQATCTVGVESDELSVEDVLAIARSLVPASEAVWSGVPVAREVPGDRHPTVPSPFRALQAPRTILETDGARLQAQTIAPGEHAPTQDPLLMLWIEEPPGTVIVHYGLSTAPGMPAPQRVPGGILHVIEVPRAAHTVRVLDRRWDPIELRPIVPHPRSPTAVAALVHEDWNLRFASFDADGEPIESPGPHRLGGG